MNFIKEKGPGLALALSIAIPAWVIGLWVPIIGGPVIAIITGMIVKFFVKNPKRFDQGIRFTSKKILQWAVVLLGFGMNLTVVFETGKESFPIIVSTITTSLLLAYLLSKLFKIPTNIATLVGVGSSICGGSAIAATAPVIGAKDEDIVQAISVIFLFNIIAALLFPTLGMLLGFDTTSGHAFGIFAGTAINDTSSVTAAASTWDSMWNLGNATLDKAVTVKLTRTLAIIPITLILAFIRTFKEEKELEEHGEKVSFRKVFPFFILFFILASLITTVAIKLGFSSSIFLPVKELSKFFIIMAMAAIGLHTNLVHLIKTGGKPILLGFICWIGITVVSLLVQNIMGIW